MTATDRAPLLRFVLWAPLVLAFAFYVDQHASALATWHPRAPPAPGLGWAPPVGGAAPWLVLAGAVVGGAVLARRISAPLRLIAWGLASYALVVVPAQILGLGGWASSRGLFRPWLWAGLVWLAVLGLLLWPRGPSSAGDAVPRAEASREPLLPWLVAVALAVAALYVHSVGRAIHDGVRGWDGEAYHLPMALQWTHSMSLTEPLRRLLSVSPQGIGQFANPGNGQLLMSLPLLVGWDRLTCFVQVPFLALGAWAVGSLARAAGAAHGSCRLAVLAFLSAPILAAQAAAPMLDLATAALSLTALGLLVPACGADAVPRERLALAGLASGLALGTKTTALSHLGLLALVLVMSRWAWRSTGRGRAAVSFVGWLLVPAAFWYLRSSVLFGNPTHPIRIGLLGYELVPGTTAEDMSGAWGLQRMGLLTTLDWLAFPFRDPEFFDESGLGALLVSFGVVGALAGAAAPWVALRQRRLTPQARLAILGVAALLLFWFGAARTPRFNLPLLGIAAAAIAPATDALGERMWRHAAGALALAACLITVAIALAYDPWDMGPPMSRARRLVSDYPAISPQMDTLRPMVVYNDTRDDDSARPSNYWLFGADHRHMVYEHPELARGDAAEFLSRLRLLDANAVFLRTRRGRLPPARYATPRLDPILSYEGTSFRSTLYRIRSPLATP